MHHSTQTDSDLRRDRATFSRSPPATVVS